MRENAENTGLTFKFDVSRYSFVLHTHTLSSLFLLYYSLLFLVSLFLIFSSFFSCLLTSTLWCVYFFSDDLKPFTLIVFRCLFSAHHSYIFCILLFSLILLFSFLSFLSYFPLYFHGFLFSTLDQTLCFPPCYSCFFLLSLSIQIHISLPTPTAIDIILYSFSSSSLS